MSREEPVVCSSPDLIAPPIASVPSLVPSSSRASSISSLRATGLANGSTERLTDAHPFRTPSSQSPLRGSSSDVMPPADGSADGSGKSTPDVDSQIIEALKSKDRLFVLKLGEQMESLIGEKNHSSRSKFTVSPENQYQRLLVHRCAQYYRLLPENDPNPRDKSGVRDMTVSLTPEGQIPLRRVFELVPAEHTSHPTFKIMRRTEQDRRRQKPSISRPGSTAGEDGELSDPGPSETGSMGSRSTTSKKRMTIAEREAAYEAARSRIFMDFEEKEKAKERDTSASSSTLSLASASGSGSQSGGAGCSSISDVDDSASTAPTESEWSVPGTDRRRGDSGFNSADSTRSFPPFNASGSAHERASGTTSPAFTFPSLYEPPVQSQSYEQRGCIPSQGYGGPPFPMYFAHPPPPNASPMPGPNPSYVAPYQFFPQYQYTSPPPPLPPPHPSSGPSSPVSRPVEGYPQHSASVPYIGPPAYAWMQPFHQQQQGSLPENQPPPAFGQAPVQSPSVQGPPSVAYPYPPFMPTPGSVPYPGYPPYFQPPSQPLPHMVHPHSQPIRTVELPPTNGNGSGHGTPSVASSGKGSPSPTLSRHTSSSGSSIVYVNHMNGNSSNKRGVQPARGAWSFGPGLGMRSSVSGPGAQATLGGEGVLVPPRLTSTTRRTSGASSNSSGYRTPGDETASVVSSSTSSSSSQRTYSKHPLPPRPDWATGLKAQPTLHSTARHRHDGNNSRTMSPARPPGPTLHNSQQPPSQQRPPIHLQPADFPPLSSLSNGPSGRRPLAGSAWSNNGPAARAVLSPNPAHNNQSNGVAYGTALFNHSNADRLEDDDHGYARPPPKGNPELFNPKANAKRTSQSHSPSQQPPAQGSAQGARPETVERKIDENQEPCETIASAILIDKMGSLKIHGQNADNELESTPKADSVLSGFSKSEDLSTGEGLNGVIAGGKSIL